jgi:hypothetical protein
MTCPSPTLRVVVYLLLAALLAPSVRAQQGDEAAGWSASGLFTYLRTVQLTPDDYYSGGGFVRIYYLPPKDRLLVTFNATLSEPAGSCTDSAHVFMELTLDLPDTETRGTVDCVGGDIGSLLVGSSYYLVNMQPAGGLPVGWRVSKYDALTWTRQAEYTCGLDFTDPGNPTEMPGDQMVAFVNGQLDVSSQYNATHTMPDLETGAATHHRFFTPDLQFLGKRTLADTPHICGSSMLFLEGTYYLVSADAFFGDVVVMSYDAAWHFLEVKTLIHQAHWSTGLAWDGQRFYLAYMDTSQRTPPNSLPVNLNVRLAAFDRQWNLIEDVPVTSFTWADLRQPGRPYLLLHGNRLYVSYDCDTIDPISHEEERKGQVYVAIFEVAPPRVPRVRKHFFPRGTSCPGPLSSLGVLRSSDHGATWTSLGNACMQGSPVHPVDPAGLFVDGKVVLYVVDFAHLNQPVDQTIYRTTSEDGLVFDTPQPVYTQSRTMVDPTVVRLGDGSYRMYVTSDQEGIISATSSDGLSFVKDSGVRTTEGGMIGGLLLPDQRLRFFLNGVPVPGGPEGIFSMISGDGLTLTLENDYRIIPPTGRIAIDACPIHLHQGGYLMSYELFDSDMMDHPDPWTFTEIHLATSADGLNWAPDGRILGHGGTQTLVELPDGTLLDYFVNQ